MEKRVPKVLSFSGRVMRDFFLRNHGLLLASAVAHNMMLSLIPLSALLMVASSHFYPQAVMLESLGAEISMIAPGFAPTLTEVMLAFLKTREWVGWVGLLMLLFFSSFAFRIMEDAIAIIFHRPLPTLKRRFWVSALMPYLFILIVTAGLIVITTVNAVLDVQSRKNHVLFGFDLEFHQYFGTMIYITGVLGQVLLFTLFYKIMPVATISFRRALAGGITATILWEIVRYLLVYYYTNISMVNVLYGSMATIIIVLLTMEAIALILLLGAQVIANLQCNANAGIPWHEDPEKFDGHRVIEENPTS
jgi:YihY family inner membrane protein